MNREETIVNRVEKSGLLTIDLQDYLKDIKTRVIDLKDYLFQGLVSVSYTHLTLPTKA